MKYFTEELGEAFVTIPGTWQMLMLYVENLGMQGLERLLHTEVDTALLSRIILTVMDLSRQSWSVPTQDILDIVVIMLKFHAFVS